MAALPPSIAALLRRVFGLFGWRGRRLLLTLRDLRDWLGAPSPRIPLQPWRMQADFPAGTVTVATIEPPPPHDIPAPVVLGSPHAQALDGRRMEVLPRRLYRLPEALVLPGHAALDRTTGRIVPHPILMGEALPHNGLTVYPDGRLSMPQPLRRRAILTIDEPVFVADTSHQIYGHILLEVMPRLLLLEHCPPQTRVLTGAPLRAPYSDMFAAMGVEADRLVPLTAPVHCRTTYLADNLVDLRNFVAPEAWEAFARLGRLGDRSTIPTVDRLYVSRRGINRRVLENEAEIEALFERNGFAIVRPEKLSFADQVRLFTHARLIAGPGGSALHNMVFSSAETRLLIITQPGMVLAIDALLSRKPGALTYVLGTSRNPARRYIAPWTIDLADVEQALATFLG